MITIDDVDSCGDARRPVAVFNWHFTNWCNYQCAYCPVLDSLTKDFTKPDHAQMHDMVISRLKLMSHQFTVCLSGGEPTLNPNLLNVATKLNDIKNCKRIDIMTNLAMSVDTYRNIAKIKSDKVVIMASYHPQYFSDRFLQKAILLSSEIKRFKIMVNFVDDRQYWDDLQLTMETLYEHGIKAKPNLMKSNRNWQANYTQEFYDRFYKYFDGARQYISVPVTLKSGKTLKITDHEMEVRGLDDFRQFMCTPLMFNIDIQGRITNDCTGHKVGLRMDDIVRPVVCPYNRCHGRHLLTFYKKRI